MESSVTPELFTPAWMAFASVSIFFASAAQCTTERLSFCTSHGTLLAGHPRASPDKAVHKSHILTYMSHVTRSVFDFHVYGIQACWNLIEATSVETT